MKRSNPQLATLALGLFLMLSSGFADAQWVMLARHAIGRVEQMSQQSQVSGGANYDSASVMIDAPPDKVWATVVRGVQGRSDLKITKEDASGRLIQFSNGAQIAGIKVNGLGDDLTQILVTSAHTGSQPDASALVSNSVLRVCKDMNVQCSRPAQ